MIRLTVMLVIVASAWTGAAEPKQSSPVPEAVRTAGWKSPLPDVDTPQDDLSLYDWRLGKWESTTWVDDRGPRYKLRIEYQRDLEGNVLRGTSYRIFADGTSERHLEVIFYPNAARNAMTTYLFFSDGLFADAVWTDDGDGIQRLDCDLVTRKGGKAQVRDVFIRKGDDRYDWAMYWVRGGVVDEEPSFEIEMMRVP